MKRVGVILLLLLLVCGGWLLLIPAMRLFAHMATIYANGDFLIWDGNVPENLCEGILIKSNGERLYKN